MINLCVTESAHLHTSKYHIEVIVAFLIPIHLLIFIMSSTTYLVSGANRGIGISQAWMHHLYFIHS